MESMISEKADIQDRIQSQQRKRDYTSLRHDYHCQTMICCYIIFWTYICMMCVWLVFPDVPENSKNRKA